MRACIGRPFAWQEAMLAVATLLQNFDFRLDDPSYELAIKSTLTIKPKGFYMHACLRGPERPISSTQESFPATRTMPKRDSGIGFDSVQAAEEKPSICILYGSNTGTCESLANTLAKTAEAHGFNSRVETLDKGTGNIPNDQPLVIITASYEGEPPDNATHFVSWLKGLNGSELSGVQFAVFGCGNRMPGDHLNSMMTANNFHR
jgi:cytochrome P450/NADPH-cytochrome P450 reductase